MSSLGLAGLLRRALKPFRERPDSLGVKRARGGQRYSPRGSDEELHAKALLQRSDRAGGGAGRHGERVRRAGKTPPVGHRQKDPQGFQFADHGCVHYCNYCNK